MSDFLTRFAPSPTGLLHLGHAFSAITAFEAAKAAGGTFLLRIEDIDTARCRLEFEEAIFDDLTFLGLDWPQPVRRQSAHFPEYARALESLARRGLVYRCFKTRKEIADEIARAPHAPGEGPEGVIYPGPEAPLTKAEEDALIAKGKPYAWRLSVTACRDELGAAWDALHFIEEGEGPEGEHGLVRARPETLGDVILGRKDVGASYHLAAVHDDALQDVTHVIRGQDLFFATHLHALLQHLMELPRPVYRHHRLLLDEHGKRFAKRDDSATIRTMRAAGMSAAEIRAKAGARPF
ncbi:MAG: tRNA glutamyl-Q(34) synthetase GluQRS [Oceanicaulis sp.]